MASSPSPSVMPSAPEAERTIVGAAMVSADSLRAAAAIVRQGDFYDPSMGVVFAAACDVDRAGGKADPAAVADRLRSLGLLEHVGGNMALVKLMSEAASLSNSKHLATVVAEKAALRRMLVSLDDLKAMCVANQAPGDVIDAARRSFDAIDLPFESELPEGSMSLDDWMDRDVTRKPWVVPGLLRQEHRAVLVAPEGAGKSWVSSQIAVAASQGIHPFGFSPIPPVNSLIIDAENPDDVIDHRARWMLGQARKATRDRYRRHGCWIWSQPGGLDIRSRKDRARIEALLRHVRPELVVLGPLYKVFRKRAGEDHEDAALEAMDVLDGLRIRHGFALVIEAHAPHGTSPALRELRIRGSVAWMGWPEFVFGLRPDDETGSLSVERPRGERAVAAWPDRLDRSKEWPWVGWWPDASWKESAA